MPNQQECTAQWIDAAERYEAARIEGHQKRTVEEERLRRARRKREQKRSEKIRQHRDELIAFTESDEFVAARRLLAVDAADCSIPMGDLPGNERGQLLTFSLTGDGFRCYDSRPGFNGNVTEANLIDVARAFHATWDNDYHDNYPGGIMEFIRKRLGEIAHRAPRHVPAST